MRKAQDCPCARILTINGGSSSIKFALFEAGDSLRRILAGGIERIGLPDATLRMKGVREAGRQLLAAGERRPITRRPWTR